MTFTAFLTDQSDILKHLLELYFRRTKFRVIDLTYGRGALWSDIRNDPLLRRQYLLTKCDAIPTSSGVKRKNLLTDDYSLLGLHHSALYGPPYLIGRKSFDYHKASRKSWARRGGLRRCASNQTLQEFNRRVECLRDKAATFLHPSGLLIVKVMDPRKDGKLIPHHYNIINILSDKFELIDVALYVRLGATTWQVKNHLQNLHGYWLVFQLRETATLRQGFGG